MISTSEIPEQLNFLSTNFSAVLDNGYFKDLKVQRSIDRSSIAFNLDIVSYSEILKLKIPGTGLVLILNPDLENPIVENSVIPLALTWIWGIKQYLQKFKISNFSFSPESFFDQISSIFKISDEELLARAVNSIIDSANPLKQFVIDANIKYAGLNIPYPSDSNFAIAIANTVLAINSYPGLTVKTLLFQDYVINEDSNITFLHLTDLLHPFLGFDSVESFKNLLIPVLSASIQLSAGLEIPRTTLIPLKSNGEIESDPEIKTILLLRLVN